jgi:hypothetical protein
MIEAMEKMGMERMINKIVESVKKTEWVKTDELII